MRLSFHAVAGFVLLVGLLAVSACGKEKKKGPTIEIISPYAWQMYDSSNGDTVHIRGTATDNHDLHNLFIRIVRRSDDSVYFSANPYVHATKTYDINEWWLPLGITRTVSLVLVVEAEDHDHNTTTKRVDLMVIP